MLELFYSFLFWEKIKGSWPHCHPLSLFISLFENTPLSRFQWQATQQKRTTFFKMYFTKHLSRRKTGTFGLMKTFKMWLWCFQNSHVSVELSVWFYRRCVLDKCRNNKSISNLHPIVSVKIMFLCHSKQIRYFYTPTRIDTQTKIYSSVWFSLLGFMAYQPL